MSTENKSLVLILTLMSQRFILWKMRGDAMEADTLFDALIEHNISRRDFLKFCSAMAAALGLSASYVPRIAHALETKQKPILVWLEIQSCTGDTEALLRASKPTVAEIVLDILSLDYHETIMAAAGIQAEKSLADVVKNHKGKYFVAIEGSIPTKDGGVYCCVGGRASVDIVREVCGSALATLAMGTCACFGAFPTPVRIPPVPSG